jgi:hypothetical protein
MQDVKPYHERQRGGLCRLHSLNAFLGGPVYTEDDFHRLCREYDAAYPTQPAVEHFDAAPGTQECFVAWVLRTRHALGGLYIAPGRLQETLQLYGVTALEALCGDTGLFVFNDGHIWCVKRGGSAGWWDLNSLGVARRVTDLTPYTTGRLGFYVVWSRDQCTERITWVSRALQRLVGGLERIDSMFYVCSILDERHLMEPYETLLGTFYRLWSVIHGKSHAFYQQFYDGFQLDPGNTVHILEHAPPLLHYAMQYPSCTDETPLRRVELLKLNANGTKFRVLVH